MAAPFTSFVFIPFSCYIVSITWHNSNNTFFSITHTDKCIPKSACSPTQEKEHPWLTKRLIQTSHKRIALFKRAKIFCDICTYKLYWNKSQLAQTYNPKQPKEFWKACKLLHKSSNSSIPVLTSDGIISQSSMENAKLLNTYYISC